MRSLFKRSTFTGLLLAGLLAPLGGPLPAHAADLFVNPWVFSGASDANTCFSPIAPCLTIGRAVDAASSGDTIFLVTSSLVAFGDIDIEVDKTLTFTGSCLDAGCSGGRVKWNARGMGRHLWISAAGASVTMSNVDLYNGSEFIGGSILNEGTLTVSNCNIHSNTAASQGGGVYVAEGANLHLNSGSILASNEADEGGAVFNAGGNVTAFEATFIENEADDGGAVFNDDGEVTSTLTSFLGNSADDGGAVFNAAGYVMSLQTSFIYNHAVEGNGGAITNIGDATLLITRSEFTRNDAATGGGAIADFGTGEFSVTHGQFSGNSAITGGAIHAAPVAAPWTVATAINAATFAENEADSGGAIYYQPTDGELTVVNSTFSQNVASGVGGGAIYSGSLGIGSVALASTTFFRNVADLGASIYNGRPMEMNNSIVNESLNLGGAFVDACYNSSSITGRSNLVGTQAIGLVDRSCNASAIFNAGYVTRFDQRLQDNFGPGVGAFNSPTLTHALFLASGASPRSNAIDRIPRALCLAPNGSLLTEDQRGLGRPRPSTDPNAKCDVGAVEQK